MKVIIPTPLRPSMNNQDVLDLNFEGTIQQLLETLVRDYPKVRVYLLDDNNALRPFINVYVNDTDCRDLEAVNTPLSKQDTVSLLPSIAGGSH